VADVGALLAGLRPGLPRLGRGEPTLVRVRELGEHRLPVFADELPARVPPCLPVALPLEPLTLLVVGRQCTLRLLDRLPHLEKLVGESRTALLDLAEPAPAPSRLRQSGRAHV